MTNLTIGVDISKEHFDAYRSHDDAHRQFNNTKTGLRAFIKWVCHDNALIVFEPTGPYHRAFESACAKAGLPLCKVNPKQARRFAQATGTLAKTDKVDARMLARMGSALELPPTVIADESLRTLKELLQARRALVKDRAATKNRLCTLTVGLLKRQHTKRVKLIEAEIAAIDAMIDELIAQDDDLQRKLEILCSIPGIAKTTAFTLLIEMPELGTLDKRQAAALAGLAPTTQESGQWRGRASIRGGRKLLRDALYMPAMVAMRFNQDCKERYQALIKRGKPAKVAITAIMRKLLITANALIRDNREWKNKTA